ncbi:MAG: competence/damage-inducible protein A [Betaproteobacteria bacterium]|nr:competence/damage-inducible protein A [Betaproteobacteria bacterium]
MAIGILVIGDEILSGKRQDKHFAKAIEILGKRGLELGWAEYLGDDPARITASLRRTFATDDVVFSFGGIGATPDDHTRQCAAAALGRPLARHPDAVRELEARFGKDTYPRRVLLAEFPEGAEVVPNPVNRVAGFSVGTHYFLPGFPEMAWAMMEWALDTKHRALFRDRLPFEEAIIVDGAGESDLLEIMNAVVRDYPELKLSSLPTFSVGGSRLIELAVRGDPVRVPVAMAWVREAIAGAGYAFRERPAKPAGAAP